MFGHRSEIPIGMQQGMAVFDTIRADDEIGGFSDGDAPLAKPTIMHCGFDGQIGRQHWNDLELGHSRLHICSVLVVLCTLKDFKQHDIA